MHLKPTATSSNSLVLRTQISITSDHSVLRPLLAKQLTEHPTKANSQVFGKEQLNPELTSLCSDNDLSDSNLGCTPCNELTRLNSLTTSSSLYESPNSKREELHTG